MDVGGAAGGGHPAAAERLRGGGVCARSRVARGPAGALAPEVYDVPKEIDDDIARMKLEAVGVQIDELTEEQKKYLTSWEMGT